MPVSAASSGAAAAPKRRRISESTTPSAGKGGKARASSKNGSSNIAKTAGSGNAAEGKSFVEFQKILREQKLLLSKLRKENEQLRNKVHDETQLGAATAGAGLSQMNRVSKLAEEAELFVSRIEAEKKKANDLDRKIKEVDRSLGSKRGQADGLDKFSRDARQIEASLEERLHKAKKKWGETITSNKKLRSEINELRLEHAYFRQAFQKSEQQLDNVTGNIESIVESSKNILEERTGLANQIADIKHMSDEEQKAYMQQVRELSAVLKAFEDSETRMHVITEGNEADEDHLGNMTQTQEEELQRKIVRGKWQLAKEKALSDLLKDQASTFEEAFAKIQAATGYTQMDDFVRHFVRIEEHNFHRFKYLNSLIVEIEKLGDDVSQLREQAKEVSNKETSTMRPSEPVKSTSKAERVEAMAEHHSQEAERLSDLVEKFGARLKDMAAVLNVKPASQVINREEETVTDANMLSWLGSIELRCDRLIGRILKKKRSQSETLPGGPSSTMSDGPEMVSPSSNTGPPDLTGASAERAESPTEESQDGGEGGPRSLGKDARPLVRPPSIKEDDPQFFDDEAEMDLPLEHDQLKARVSALSDQLFQTNVMWQQQGRKPARKPLRPSGSMAMDGHSARTSIRRSQSGHITDRSSASVAGQSGPVRITPRNVSQGGGRMPPSRYGNGSRTAR